MTGPSHRKPDTSTGLAPLAGLEPLVLILGSFPSVLSLTRGEYYGNPRNRFWAVMEELFGIPVTLRYPERCQRLTGERVALWDVVAACSRPGSADSRIRDPVPNDIVGLMRANPSVRLIALNGSAAARLYHQLAEVKGIPSVTLPSTSPANAAVTFGEKVREWGIVRASCIRD
jgi:double-stranded uracil-DNA glycosylase